MTAVLGGPAPNVLNLSMSPANRETGEAVIRAGIDRADCVVETTSICSGCPRFPADLALPRFYPELVERIGRRFHTVPVSGCDGCTLYVREVSSRASAAPRRKRSAVTKGVQQRDGRHDDCLRWDAVQAQLDHYRQGDRAELHPTALCRGESRPN